jgi:Cu-Zn family superoxide dismutase
MGTSGRGRSHLVALAIACGALVVACGAPAPTAPAQPTPSAPAAPAADPTSATAETDEPDEGIDASGLLAAPESAGDAFTYNPGLAPAGARMEVTASESDTGTTVRLQVGGLQPNRGYAAHVHQQPCGPTGAAAGPHHQHEVDPAAAPDTPSADPAFANPRNEIWLDLRTDGSGNGAVEVQVPFTLDDRSPASVIVHEAEKTATEPGKAGTAGARIACLSVPFADV